MNLINLKSIMNSRTTALIKLLLSLAIIVSSPTVSAQNQETNVLAPPSLGEETKGKPAIPEVDVEKIDSATAEAKKEQPEAIPGLGSTTVTEHKRENGQVYLIELENSLGGKQYLYENDSDGQIGSSVEDNESIKEIPKWKLGSW